MPYALRDGVSLCFAGGRHFFFDKALGRYAALSARDEQLFCRLAEDASTATVTLTPALRQLLREAPQPALGRPVAARPAVRALEPARSGGLPWQDLLGAALILVRVKARLRYGRLDRLLSSLAAAKADMAALASEGSSAPAQLARLACAFETLRAWTSKDQCLPLSLAYARAAYRLGYRVDIVFGITPRPFSAHCWVQLGDRVLNDQLARVETFTPIYAQ